MLWMREHSLHKNNTPDALRPWVAPTTHHRLVCDVPPPPHVSCEDALHVAVHVQKRVGEFKERRQVGSPRLVLLADGWAVVMLPHQPGNPHTPLVHWIDLYYNFHGFYSAKMNVWIGFSKTDLC